MIPLQRLIGTHDLLFVTLDTLRYDVAVDALARGWTPRLASYLPGGVWERRHTPGNFTFAAHSAFFAGFLPTPAAPGRHPRLFAAAFPGSETTGEDTFTFEEPDLVHALATRGYHTACIGGVGFFNKLSALGSVFPSMFHESHWSPEMGVTDRHSTEHQVQLAQEIIARLPDTQRLLLFLNISALHQPNCIFAEGATEDSQGTQAAALAYVDRHLPDVFAALQRRAPVVVILCSDHGTAYGEDGYTGHRLCHEVVWTVPYAEFVLPREGRP